MEKRKILTLLLAAVFYTGILFAGGQQEESSGMGLSGDDSAIKGERNLTTPNWLIENTDEQITVIDSGGHSITISKPVKNVIAVGMAVFPSLRAIGAEEMVIATQGIDEIGGRILYPYMVNLPLIADKSGPGASIDYEGVVELDPDAIFCLADSWSEVNERLSPIGIPVVQLDFASLDDINILGAILDREVEAQEYVAWIEDKVGFVEDRTKKLAQDERPEVFLYYGGNYGMSPPPPYGTYGKANDLGNKTIRIAGGRSITADVPGEWITVDPEWLIEKNPDVIIREYYITSADPELGYTVTGDEKVKAKLAEIVSFPAFELSNAVNNGNVYMIYGDLISDTWFLGLQYMAKWLHPDLFPDLDPQALQQEYLKRFLRIDFDLSEKGLFVSQVMKGRTL